MTIRIFKLLFAVAGYAVLFETIRRLALAYVFENQSPNYVLHHEAVIFSFLFAFFASVLVLIVVHGVVMYVIYGVVK